MVLIPGEGGDNLQLANLEMDSIDGILQISVAMVRDVNRGAGGALRQPTPALRHRLKKSDPHDEGDS